MLYKETENKLASQKKNRPKIQDILPRKNPRDSLLAKIMGPRFAPSEPERNVGGGFARSLPFRRWKGGKSEKVIRLKKAVYPKPVFVSPKKAAPNQKQISVSALRRISGEPRVFEIGVKSEDPTAKESDISAGRRIVLRTPLVFGIVCVAGIVILLSTVFARATISLESSVAKLVFEGIRVEAGTGTVEIDAVGKKIPASLIEAVSSLKREFSSSAKEHVSRKAMGTVRIYNAFSSASQPLVARTRLHDPSGRTFFLKQRVTIPGAAVQNGKLTPRFISATVEAGQAGAEFNVIPSRFTIPGFAGTEKFTGFYAESQEAFAGGFEGEMAVVRQADIDAASEEVTAALFAHLKEELERKIPHGVTAIPGAREIAVMTLRKPKAGEAGEHFFVEADGKASVMLFRMDDLFALLGQLALSPDAEKKIAPDKSHFEFDRVLLSLKNRALSFEVRGTVAAVSVVSPDDVGRALAGRTRADAENILRADSRIRAFGIKLFPFWRRTIPSDTGKIRILVPE